MLTLISGACFGITTVAGTLGASGFGGDGGPATDALLNEVSDLALDPTGQYLYIGDSGNYRVRQVDLATGIITTVAGDGTSGNTGDGGLATDAQLNGSAFLGVAVDASGTFSETKRQVGLLRMMQAGVILSDYSALMVEILKDNGRPEAAAVYAALDMDWAKLVGQMAQAHPK